MGAELIDGKSIAGKFSEQVRQECAALVQGGASAPHLAVVVVGENPASLSYIRGKKRACERAGITTTDHHLSESTTTGELLQLIEGLNKDTSVHAILVQLPLPGHIDADAIIAAVDPVKDVDGFHPANLGLLLAGKPRYIPCTPLGIVRMLAESGVRIAGADVVVVGRSSIVGMPLAVLLMSRGEWGNATVTVAHSKTSNLAAVTRQADILIAAIGSANFIKADMVKAGAVVIDVGVNRVEDSTRERGYYLCGDVDFAAVSERASRITPVPGGVGPLTIAMLLANTLQACRQQSVTGGDGS